MLICDKCNYKSLHIFCKCPRCGNTEMSRTSKTDNETKVKRRYRAKTARRWWFTKKAIVKRDGDSCSRCNYKSNLSIYHVTPLSKGGTNHVENLILLCVECAKRR